MNWVRVRVPYYGIDFHTLATDDQFLERLIERFQADSLGFELVV